MRNTKQKQKQKKNKKKKKNAKKRETEEAEEVEECEKKETEKKKKQQNAKREEKKKNRSSMREIRKERKQQKQKNAKNGGSLLEADARHAPPMLRDKREDVLLPARPRVSHGVLIEPPCERVCVCVCVCVCVRVRVCVCVCKRVYGGSMSTHRTPPRMHPSLPRAWECHGEMEFPFPGSLTLHLPSTWGAHVA